MGVQQIKRVVVLMLENRSFDHMLGDFDDVDGASPSHTNLDGSGQALSQTRQDNFTLPFGLDPKHEFKNVQVQLGPPAAVYPMSGFVQDAEAAASKIDAFKKLPPDKRRQVVQTVMDYFSKGALPGLHTLASEFTICDHWFSSVPGPTWPNRFFAMMGSCHGQLEMPSGPADAIVTVRAIAAQLGKESIFSVLGDDVTHKVYSDYLVPLSILLKGSGHRGSLTDFESDASSGRLPSFSWIEPDYSSNLAKANSQHPPENVLRGDNLIVRVYNAVRASPQWPETLLVILHDEHGGFYDHVPPAPTQSADDHPSHPAFDYSYTGLRVPCVLVSPWINRGVAIQTYDHTSLLAFVCDQFGVAEKRALLGRRVAATSHFGSALVWADEMRNDTPARLTPSTVVETLGEEASADLSEQLPQLLVALDAYATNQKQLTTAMNLRIDLGVKDLSRELDFAASHGATIEAAWSRSGELSSHDVERMLQNVKETFSQ